MTTTIAQSTATDAFVGTWELASFEVRRSDGTVAYPLGPDAIGRISYDDQGRMAVQVMRRERPLFASGDMLDGSDDERRDAWDGFISYAGGWTLDADAGTITHDIEISSFPNWVGDSQTRFYDFVGNTLELTTPPLAYGGGGVVAALVWTKG